VALDITQNASQATQVEQARTIASVLGSIEAARRWPRDEDAALRRFLSSCSRKGFAEKAFFRFRRGSEQLTGPTIDFALEALRCWGNTESGSTELVRRTHESEMLAYAVDLETNSARRTIFVNPHTNYTATPKTDEGTGEVRMPKALVAVRDIRENNQSAGSRVEREMILASLPSWYVEEGIARCYATLAGNSDEPIEDRRRKLVEWFETNLSVDRGMMVGKIGVAYDRWLPADLATLGVIGRAIKRGEATVEAEFGRRGADAPTVTGADLDGAGPVDQPADEPAAEDVSTADGQGEPEDGAPASGPVNSAIAARMAALGLAGRSASARDSRARLLGLLAGRTVDAANPLTAGEARGVQEWLDAATPEAVEAMLDDAHGEPEGEPGGSQ
jgi:hypothetical protein